MIEIDKIILLNRIEKYSPEFDGTCLNKVSIKSETSYIFIGCICEDKVNNKDNTIDVWEKESSTYTRNVNVKVTILDTTIIYYINQIMINGIVIMKWLKIIIIIKK